MKKKISYRVICIALVISMLFANFNFVFAADDDNNTLVELLEKMFWVIYLKI